MGYHITQIEPGVYGELSKVREEFEEAVDAFAQSNPVMLLQELSDMLGAIEAVAAKYNVTLADLVRMHEATKRAFADGTRAPRQPRKGVGNVDVCTDLTQAEIDAVNAYSGIDIEEYFSKYLQQEARKSDCIYNQQVLDEMAQMASHSRLVGTPDRGNVCCEIPLGEPQPCELTSMDEDAVRAMVAAIEVNKPSVSLSDAEATRLLDSIFGPPEVVNGPAASANAPITTGVLSGLAGVKKRLTAGPHCW